MKKKNPKYLVNFGYSLLDQSSYGELPQLLMTFEETKHWLCILNPLKVNDWMFNLGLLKKKEKMFLKIVDNEMIKVVKIQRN